RWPRDWSSDVCSSDLNQGDVLVGKAQLAPGAGRQLGHPGGVTVVERRFEVHGITKGMTDAVKPELVDAHQGPRFRLYGGGQRVRSEERRVGKGGRSRG